MRKTPTGALSTNDYLADKTFDKKYDRDDTLAGRNLRLYCLESSISFSCGNLVPAVFKEDPHVALIGQRSSGGSCSVTFLSTAIGSSLRLSSSHRMSCLRNGSFYDIDQGVEPDLFIPPEEQIWIINNKVTRSDTFICLGDVGNPDYAAQIKAGHKVLLLGNHDRRKDYKGIFDEIYEGPLFISEKILLSHEPVYGLSWCLNIHGHDHNGRESYAEDCKHLNLAANVCEYTPVSLGQLIKDGILADISSIHRQTIDRASDRKQMKKQFSKDIPSEELISSIEERSDEK